jgi:hypothetical protein
MEDPTKPQPHGDLLSGVSSSEVEKHDLSLEALEHWLNAPTYQFVNAVRHEMLNFFMPILGYTELINELSDLDTVLMRQGDKDFTLRDFCDVVLRQQDKVYNLRDVLLAYVKATRDSEAQPPTPQPSKPTE